MATVLGAGQLLDGLTPQELLATQKHHIVGPVGLAFLLERVADWGTEEPSWRDSPPPFRSEPPPAPIQILVPETVIFDKDGKPSALMFTDRGGFLRALKRPLRKEPQAIYADMLTILKQRRDAKLRSEAIFLASLEKDCQKSSFAVQTQREHVSFGATLKLENTGSVLATVDEGKSDFQSTIRSETMRSDRPATERRSRVEATRVESGKLEAIRSKDGKRKQRERLAVHESWRLLLSDGTETRLTNEEVASCFGAGTSGDNYRWPSGSRLLQALFWMESEKKGSGAECFYHYDALEHEVQGAKNPGMANIITNHFERYKYLTDAKDRNQMSAFPNLISQHTAYHCNLELLSGDFGFARDQRGQLWLAEARNLYFLPIVSRHNAAKNGPTSSEPPPRKLFRYMSEEALQNFAVDERTGNELQGMLEQMTADYQDFKQTNNIDALLRKEHERVHVNIPVFTGTDLKALSKTFGLQGTQGKKLESDEKVLKDRNLKVVAPKRCPLTGRGGRYLSTEAREMARKITDAQKHFTAHQVKLSTVLSTKAESEVSVESLGDLSQSVYDGRRSITRRPTMSSVASDKRPSTASHRRAVRTLSQKVPGTHAPVRLEIVSSANAQRLLPGSGPGMRPEGMTLDLISSSAAARAMGVGLRMRCKAAAPTAARMVVVPPGAASAAMARIKACMAPEQQDVATHEQ